MRVLIAPDKFAGTLTALQAAEAIAEGWQRRAPHDELDLLPMSDGGPGFVEIVHRALGGELVATTARGPYGEPVPATVLEVGGVAYLESAQAVGLHLTEPAVRRPMRASSTGAGELLATAIDLGARTVHLGLGGSGTNDGGAGLLGALGATATGARLDAGPAGLAALETVDLAPARARADAVGLIAACDVDNPLLGLLGATKNYGPQKGLTEAQLLEADGLLQRFAEAADRKLAAAPRTGAAGGLGYALALLGADLTAGVDLVADLVGLTERVHSADLVITGEGAFDFSSRSGKVPYGVAQAAVEALRPCVALAGQVHVGSREMRALGIESAYSMVETVGEERAFGDPAGALADLAERVARTWSPAR